MSMNEEEEKDLELKDLIVQTLESNGLLAKMKAQIRASVFMALDENDTRSDGAVPQVQILPEVIRQPNQAVERLLDEQQQPYGSIVASLVRDFLEVCNLDYTLGVFDPELNHKGPLNRRKQLQATLKLISENENLNENGNPLPVLLSLVEKQLTTMNQPQSQSHFSGNNQSSVNYRAFFETHGSSYGPISKRQVLDLFADLFTEFSPQVLKTFVNTELNDANGSSSDSQTEDRSEMNDKIIDVDMFVEMCNKWHTSCQRTTTAASPTQTQNENQADSTIEKKEVDDFNGMNDDGEDNNEPSSIKRKKEEEEDNEKSTTFSRGDQMMQNIAAPSQPPIPPPSQLPAVPEKKKTTATTNVMFRSNDTEADDGGNYDEDDFTTEATNTPRTPRTTRKSPSKMLQAMGHHGGGLDDDNNISYCEESLASSRMDELTQDKSVNSNAGEHGTHGADYIEDVSI